MLQGLQAGNTFRSGWDGVGASLYPLGSKMEYGTRQSVC